MSKQNKDGMFVEWVFVLAIVLMGFVFFIASSRQTGALKQEAVERGFAEWVVDSKGSATWQWKEAAK